MPRLDKAKLAPNGLSIRITRSRAAGQYVRAWRVSLDGVTPRHTFVLVHGLGVSSYYFEPLAARLARSGVVHMLDLPGFDGVPHPGRPLTIGDFADVVAGWAEQEGLTAPVLVGHSMGGQVVVEAMVRYPDLAGGGVVIGPPVNASERSVGYQIMRLAQSSLYETQPTRRAAMAGYLRSGPRWVMRVLPQLLRYPIEERIAEVAVPVLVLRGSRDSVAPGSWTATLAAACRRGTEAEIEGASHAVVYEHYRETAAQVVAHAEVCLATRAAERGRADDAVSDGPDGAMAHEHETPDGAAS